LIDPKAEPLFNIPPYKRIDLGKRSRRPVITQEDIAHGVAPMPEDGFYDYNPDTRTWTLKK